MSLALYLLGGAAGAFVAFKIYMKLTAGRFALNSYNLRGKTYVVTGGTSGLSLQNHLLTNEMDSFHVGVGGRQRIGEFTVSELFSRGATVYILCRNMGKGERVMSKIKADTAKDASAIKGGNLFVVECSLDNLESVRRAADKLLKDTDQIDVLVNNAGQGGEPGDKPKMTTDGLEQTMAANYYGHFLLTYLLLDRLKHSRPSRIVNVSSKFHSLISEKNFHVSDLSCSVHTYSPLEAYKRSKLAQVLMMRYLADKLQGTGVVSCALHPGVISTPMTKYFMPSFAQGIWIWIWSWFTKSVEEGAQTTLYCCVCEDVRGLNGGYFSDCAPEKLNNIAGDPKLAQELWKCTLDTLNLKDPFDQK